MVQPRVSSVDTLVPPVGQELRATLRLAVPVALAELGWMGMAVVDTLMVGPLGPVAIGAVGLGGTLYMAVAVFGMGMLLGLDTLVSQAFGARRLDECDRWFWQGLWAAVLLGVPLQAAGLLGVTLLPLLGLNPAVLTIAVPYVTIILWGTVPLLIYASCRRYLQALGRVRPVMFALVTANLVNLFVNWILIYGHWGAPAMGTNGSAVATVISRIYMAALLVIVIVVHERRGERSVWRVSRRVDRRRLEALLRLGTPAALQIALEVGVFAAATALVGRLDAASLAAHQIALNVASVSFMVPLGIASAAAVRVGHAIGRGNPHAASRAGWTAMAVAAAFMTLAALVLVLVPRALIAAFTSDADVLRTGVSLLAVAAMFQLFDGIQVASTGALRGAGDTRTPMIANLVGHWLFGLPVGYALCFGAGWQAAGLWVGLSAGLMAVGTVLLGVWHRRMRELERALAPQAGP